MYEFHGWARVYPTAADVDVEQSTEQAIREQIDAKIKELDWQEAMLGIRHVGDQVHVSTSGCLNRTPFGADNPVESFRYVGAVAPGSYGILYVHDTDDLQGQYNYFRVYVLARGRLEERGDPFLSPIEPVVEDGYLGQ